MAAEAEEDVREANEKLEETLKEVRLLKKEHLTEIKSFTTPSEVVKIVLQGVIYLSGDLIKSQGGEIIMGTENGKKVANYFETAKRYLLNDTKTLLDGLINYEKEKITKAQIDNLSKHCYSNPIFTLDAAKKSSYAIKFLFQWVNAMYGYYDVYTTTEPKRQALKEML